MSVLECDREGCTGIMCRRYSTEFGYICDDCFRELLNYKGGGIRQFMATDKTQLNSEREGWIYYCEQEFTQ